MRFALPLTSDILDQARGCQYFASIDLKSAYQQIPIAPQGQDLLGIRTTFGNSASFQ